MPKAFSEHEKELIGRRLLEQGYKLFSTYGLKKTNIEEIAAAAGISKGAFYLFYDSKEALFMEVVEQAEERLRQEILAAVERPGPSPRARLYAVLHQAFSLFRTMPLLRVFTGGDFERLFRRLPPEKLQQHLAADLVFSALLVERCRQAGIPIQVLPGQVSALLYPLIIAALHEEDLGQGNFSRGVDALLELVAAYCLGEVEIRLLPLPGLAAGLEGEKHEPTH